MAVKKWRRSDLLQEEERSAATGAAGDIKEKYDKIKNVFKILISETPFLMDDKSMSECEGKSEKEVDELLAGRWKVTRRA